MCEDYPWQAKYRDAVLETDDYKLQKLIAEADELILERLEDGPMLNDDESAALVTAKVALEMLKAERLANLRHEMN